MSTAELPIAMQSLLRAIGWRQAWLRAVTVIACAITVTGSMILLWFLVDAWVNLPSVVRALGPWCALFAGGIVMTYGLRRVSHTDLAGWTRRVEQTYPELQERLSTCRDLLTQPVPATRTSRWFRLQLQRETLSQLPTVDPARVVSDAAMQRAIGAMLLVVACGFLPFLWWGDGYIHLANRWWNPWANLGWGRAAAIVTDPGDGFARRDHPLSITAQWMPYRTSDDHAPPLMLCWRDVGESRWQERPLTSTEDSVALGSIPHLVQDVEWFVRGPGVESRRTITRVITPPQVRAMTAVIDAPGYTGRASQQIAVLQDLAVMAGSRVRLSVVWDRPVKSAEVHWPNGEQQMIHQLDISTSGIRGHVILSASTSGPFSLRMTTHEGLVIDEPARSLTIGPDQPPVVALLGPATLAVRPDERHAVTARAADDFGLTSAELHIEAGGVAQPPIKLAFPVPLLTTAEFEKTIDLLPWNLSAGTSVTFRVRVLDNREPHPQEGWSPPQVLVISPSALSEEERRLADTTRQARDGLASILRDLETERTMLRDIHQKTAAAAVRERSAGQEARLQELTAAHQELLENLSDWTAMLPDDDPGEALRQQVEQIAENTLSSAKNRLETAPKMSPRDQIPALSQALDDLASARTALKKVDDALIARAALGDDLQTLRQLANRSDRVAEELQANKAGSPSDALDDVQQIREQLSQIVRRRPEWQAAMDQAAREEQMQQAANESVSALAPENVSPPDSKPATASKMGGPVPVDAGAALSMAQQELQQAESQLKPGEPVLTSAAESLQDAARAFRAAIARTAGSAVPADGNAPQGKPSEQAVEVQLTGPSDSAGGNSAADIIVPMTEGPRPGQSNRNWGRLPTGLKTEILQGSRRSAHADYVRQVRQYFERIAQPTPSSPEEPSP